MAVRQKFQNKKYNQKEVILIGEKVTAVVPTNDYVLKKIFGQIGNEEITKSLISSIIGKKIEKIDLDGNTVLAKDLLDDKLGVLDIKVKFDSNIICDIEMQVESRKDIDNRQKNNVLLEQIIF